MRLTLDGKKDGPAMMEVGLSYLEHLNECYTQVQVRLIRAYQRKTVENTNR